MPFHSEITNIEQFVPDDKFDPQRDLIRVQFERQHLFASFLHRQWVVALDDPTIAPSMLEQLDRSAFRYPRAEGIRVDKAALGHLALFSVQGHAWTKTWKSQEPVREFSQARRAARMKKSTVILL